MKITIVAVGKLKERFWIDACAEYVKRLQGYCTLDIREVADIDPARAGGVDASRSKEGISILGALNSHTRVILMDIAGTQRSSEQLASRIDELALRGSSDLTFIIGGSDGVSEEVARRADETLSFGPITLPHNLARVVLLEQLYRAFKISRREPYHK